MPSHAIEKGVYDMRKRGAGRVIELRGRGGERMVWGKGRWREHGGIWGGREKYGKEWKEGGWQRQHLKVGRVRERR